MKFMTSLSKCRSICRRLALALVLMGPAAWAVAAGSSPSAALEAARRFAPDVIWNDQPTLSLNFTCQGRKAYAVMGAQTPAGGGTPRAVVAVFTAGLQRSPYVLRALTLDAAGAELSVQSLRKPAEVFKTPKLPAGLLASSTCQALKLQSAGEPEPLLIYWNRAQRKLSTSGT